MFYSKKYCITEIQIMTNNENYKNNANNGILIRKIIRFHIKIEDNELLN